MCHLCVFCLTLSLVMSLLTSGPSLLAITTQTGETNSMSDRDNPFLHFTHSNFTSSAFGKLNIVNNDF